MVQTFGEWFKQKRLAAKITQEELGKAVDRSRQQIARIESGEQTTSNAIAIKMCESVGADTREGLAFLIATQTGDEVTYERDPDDVQFYANYDGMETGDKEIMKLMAEKLRQADRKRSEGGRGR